jgi:peptidoglycan/LPS O-acetylase OafA/YrhL
MHEPLQTKAARAHFLGLDLVRGVAAIAVLIYHVDFMFGLRTTLLTGGYTAVDLFFILSGFVIASTYEADVAAGRIGFWELAKRRMARLYPLYIATTLVGYVVMTARYRENFGYFDSVNLVISAVANGLVLPSPVSVYASGTLFPFNAASWSIFYELAVNVLFYVFFARGSTRLLVGLWGLSALGMLTTIAQFGGVDVGWGAPNALAAAPRVCFSFLSGALIWRFYLTRPWSSPFWLVLLLIILHWAFMQSRLWLPLSLRGGSDLAVVTFLLPTLVMAAVGVRMGPVWARFGRFLGDISYAVYLTQDALMISAAGLTQAVFGIKIYNLAPWAGLLFVPVCIIESYFVFRFFERPARQILRSFTFWGLALRTFGGGEGAPNP